MRDTSANFCWQLYLKEIFAEHGKVVDCFNPGKGFAFVTFDIAEEAEAAVTALNGQKVLGSVLSVNVSKPKEKEENKGKKKSKSKKKKVPVEKLSESSRIFVKNVDKDADSDEIRKVFEAHGEVKDVYNPGKGFIFVRWVYCVFSLFSYNIYGHSIILQFQLL